MAEIEADMDEVDAGIEDPEKSLFSFYPENLIKPTPALYHIDIKHNRWCMYTKCYRLNLHLLPIFCRFDGHLMP